VNLATASGTTTPLNDSDFTRLAKLVQLLDSPVSGEAAAALDRIRALLTKGQISFSEAVESRAYKAAVWDAKGHPDWLKDHFQTDKHRLENDRLAIKVNHLTTVVTQLKSASVFCHACERKRRWLASIAGVPILWIWLHYAAHGVAPAKTYLYGLLLAVSPITYTWLRWRFIHWRQRVNAKSGQNRPR
jgi:hypothetical protein